MQSVGLEVNLPVTFLREDKQYIAYTPALDLSTSGATYEEAKNRFEEVVQIFFEELVKNNTLDEVLRELGWRKIRKEWRPPVVVGQETETVKVAA